jgi:hypothetical protein
MKLDQTKTWQKVDDRLARTTNPRHRRILEKLRDHMVAEANADFDLLMSTLGPEPEYRSWRDGLDVAPKGRAAVAAFYRNLIEERRHILEYDIEHLVVDDDTIVTDGVLRQVVPGRHLARLGIPVDEPDAFYLITRRLLNVWPYDAGGQIVGEQTYNNGAFRPENIQKLAPEDLPEALRLLVA